MTTLKVNKWQTTGGTTIGQTLQIVSATDTSYRTISGAGTVATWVSATITRKSSTSVLKLSFSGMFNTQGDPDMDLRWYSSLDGYLAGAGGNSSNAGCLYSTGTDDTYTAFAANTNFVMIPVTGEYLYTPSSTTTVITISIQVYAEGTKTIYLNRDGWNGSLNQTQGHNPPACLIVTEIDA